MDTTDDIIEFARWHVASHDIDPVYPVLRHYRATRNLTQEETVWLLFCYVAFYDLCSGLTLFDMTDRPTQLESVRVMEACDALPKATERRAHRMRGTAFRHLQSVAYWGRQHGSLTDFLTTGFGESLEENWLMLQHTLMSVFGNGRWAAYKTGELLMEVAGLPVTPTDAGNAWSSGPRKGLCLLFDKIEGNTPDAIAQLDAQVDSLMVVFAERGLPLKVEQVETVLCDFASLSSGRYYVGHDIDHLQHQIHAAPMLPSHIADDLWEARSATIDHRWLGEIAGWDGQRKELNRLYRDTGTIRWWEQHE